MKIANLSDPHFITSRPEGRTDDVGSTSVSKLSFVVDYCKDKGIPLLIAGDLTDSPRSWYTMLEVAMILKRGVDVYCVYGQHDLYRRETRKQTTLGVLAAMGLVKILGRKGKRIGKGVDVYGCSWKGKIPTSKRIEHKVKNVLVIHAPITNKEVPHNCIDARRFLKTHKAYHLILCGDIHRQFLISTDGRFILNTGPMMRREATEEMYNHSPSFFVWDSQYDSFDKIQIPHEPAEDVLTRDHLEMKKKIDSTLKEFISIFKKGIKIKEKRVSLTFDNWARKNKVNKKLRRAIYNRLKEVEDENCGSDGISKEVSGSRKKGFTSKK